MIKMFFDSKTLAGFHFITPGLNIVQVFQTLLMSPCMINAHALVSHLLRIIIHRLWIGWHEMCCLYVWFVLHH